MATRSYPDPEPTPDTAAFWDAAREGRFLLRFCTACGRAHWYPRSICPFCASDATEWQPGSGRGMLYSYSIMRRAAQPFVMAYVRLDEGPIMMTNIVDVDPEALRCDQPVALRFVASENGGAIPCFTVAPAV